MDVLKVLWARRYISNANGLSESIERVSIRNAFNLKNA